MNAAMLPEQKIPGPWPLKSSSIHLWCRRSKNYQGCFESKFGLARAHQRQDASEISFLDNIAISLFTKRQQDPKTYSVAKARWFFHSFFCPPIWAEWTQCQIVLGVAANLWKGCESHHLVRNILHKVEISQWTIELHKHKHNAMPMTNSWALACFAGFTYLLVRPKKNIFLFTISKNYHGHHKHVQNYVCIDFIFYTFLDIVDCRV